MYKYLIAILLACLARTREQGLISDNRQLEDIRKMLDEQNCRSSGQLLDQQ